MNIELLTAKEVTEAERLAGVSILTLEDPRVPKMGLMVALAYVSLKRDKPELKFEDVESMPFPKVLDALGLDGDDDDSKSA